MTGPAPARTPTAWRVVWWFGFVSLATDMVYEGARSVYGPLLAALGASAVVVGLVTGAGEAVALVLRLVRSEMLEVLRTDYIKFARARGLGNRAVYFSHALKNTLVPVLTITGLQLGGIIAFAIVTETVFQWPGLGSLFVNAVQFVDIPVMAAYLMFVAFVFVVTNIAVDLAYFILDPRIRSGAAQAKR